MLKYVPIYPTRDEVHPQPLEPPLRSNIINGVYPNVNTYLDIQFKLLREDLTRELRIGLNKYAEAKKMGYKTDNIKSIWIYNKVRIGSRCADSFSSFKAQFDVQSFGGIKWEVSDGCPLNR